MRAWHIAVIAAACKEAGAPSLGDNLELLYPTGSAVQAFGNSVSTPSSAPRASMRSTGRAATTRVQNFAAIAAIASAYERGGVIMAVTKFVRNFVQVAILGATASCPSAWRPTSAEITPNEAVELSEQLRLPHRMLEEAGTTAAVNLN